MRLIFCYVDNFRNIVRESFNFSTDFSCSFKNNSLLIEKKTLSAGKRLLLDPITQNISVIVGKTGSGKTNLLELIGMSEENRIKTSPESRYFLLYAVDTENDLFAIEVNRIFPKGIAYGQKITSPGLIYFRYINGRIYNPKVKSSDTAADAVIIHSFDQSAIRRGYYNGIHSDGVFPITSLNPRIHAPYDKVTPLGACWFAREYVDNLPEGNIKRESDFRIRSINWSYKLENELPTNLINSEYRFYHDYLRDKDWMNVKDVPAIFDSNLLDGSHVSLKKQFIHDLLTDYALYLRKWADQITPIDDNQRRFREALGIIRDLGIRDAHLLPDGKCPDLRKRIDWLCQYIDLHTDELYGNNGLLRQEGTDIIDIVDALEGFDDSFFEDGLFVYPLADIDFDDLQTKKLFERIGHYRADQLGVFSEELLPFEMTYLSSGEYQYAKVLGVLVEFSSILNVRGQDNSTPESIIVLLDEPETFMHPEMCRKFLHSLSTLLHQQNNEWTVQIIMTTHSPFMLSDLIPEQITRITFDDNGYCKVVPSNGRATFAADIYSIMSRDFFLEYSIGELSRRKLSALINIIKKSAELENIEERIERLSLINEVVNEIGDSLIQDTLRYMIDKAIPKNIQ